MLNWSNQAKEALAFRMNVLWEYEQACQKTSKKVLQMSKLQSSRTIQSDKVDALLEEMAICKKEEQEKKELVKDLGVIMREELEWYKRTRNLEFEELIQEYVQLQINLLS
jgi:hypothetical protein